MLDHLPPARRRLVLTAAGAVAVVLVAVAAVVVTRLVSSTPEVPQDAAGPVVVVPGYGGGTQVLGPLVTHLRERGRTVSVVPPVDENRGDLDQQAEVLDAFVDGVLSRPEARRADARTVDVVGYSAGGVVARLWVRDHGGESKARRVLTIGSPHHGTSLAGLAAEAVGCSAACRQLQPDSDLLRRLNADDETPPGPRWATLRSSSDQVVTPTDSASLDGALNVLVQEVCRGSRALHGGLPAHPVSLAMVDSALGAPDGPSRPRDVDC